MSRGYEPEEFIGPREVFPDHEQKGKQPPRHDEPCDRDTKKRSQDRGSQTNPGAVRSPEPRKAYEVRGRAYRLRASEIRAMVEVGKFRAIAHEDLREFAYAGDKALMRTDVENVLRQGLVRSKSVPHEERGSRQLLALTKNGQLLLKETQVAGKDQVFYYGFNKPREAHHDADLYRLYQKAADKLQREGGRNLRVVLNDEMKERLYRDLAKLGPDRASPESIRTVAERHGLQVIRGKIPVPDVRIEYEAHDGERARMDLELATSHYRGRNLAEKVRAGFSIYARAEDASKLRRVLDERELTAEILSL
jgi:hypothetical protein